MCGVALRPNLPSSTTLLPFLGVVQWCPPSPWRKNGVPCHSHSLRRRPVHTYHIEARYAKSESPKCSFGRNTSHPKLHNRGPFSGSCVSRKYERHSMVITLAVVVRRSKPRGIQRQGCLRRGGRVNKLEKRRRDTGNGAILSRPACAGECLRSRDVWRWRVAAAWSSSALRPIDESSRGRRPRARAGAISTVAQRSGVAGPKTGPRA